jgi:hypothetical protein
MPSKVTPADLLEKAAEILETEGHIRGSYGHHGPGFEGHCAEGALRCAGKQLFGEKVYALTGPSDAHVLHIDTQTVLISHLRQPVTTWNDRFARNADEVIDTFKHLAKDLRNEEEPS